MTLTHPKKPCAECPWRTDVDTGRFPPQRFVALAQTAYDMNRIIFACHKSVAGRETVCAGFLLRGATHNLTIRLALSQEEINPDEVSDGGYPLFEDYRAMAIANDVSAAHPALRACRGND